MPREISSLYVHFPFCLNKCNYCDFYSDVWGDMKSNEGLSQMFDKQKGLVDEVLGQHDFQWAPLETIYIGGGTPSLWGKEGAHYLRELLDGLQAGKTFADNYEYTLEVNPGAWRKGDFLNWIDEGVNRFSVGIQTFDDDFLKLLGRIHDTSEAAVTLRRLQELGANYSVDIMLGLPFSKERNRDVIAELKQMIAFGPSHVSAYILTVKEDYIYYDNLPDDRYIEEEYLKVSRFLEEHGYKHYEVSNFAKENRHSKHNFKYWKSESVAAFGPSATGLLVNPEGGAVRYKWDDCGIKFELENLSAQALRLEKFYLLLRTDLGVSFSDLNESQDKQQVWDQLIQKWSDAKLIRPLENKIFATPKGFLLLDSMMDDLFKNSFFE